MRISLICSVTVLLVMNPLQDLQAASETTPETPAALRETLQRYMDQIPCLRCELDIANIVRLSSGRISERSYTVNCLMRDHVTKISQFSRSSVEDEQAWFDIRETLIFPTGAFAEWRHPGFPGQLSFGQTSSEAGRFRHAAEEKGGPFFLLKKIARVMARDSFRIAESGAEIVMGRVTVPPRKTAGDQAAAETAEADYIEIVFAREFGLLPVSMTRICKTDDVQRTFESGGSIEIEYSLNSQGQVVPKFMRQDDRLKDDVQGSLATTWTFRTFDLTARPTVEEMKLTLPVQILAANVDSREQFTVTSKEDDAADELKKWFGEFIEIQPVKAAMLAVADSFVGKCPDLPDQYHLLREQRSNSLSASGSPFWSISLLAGHGFGVCVVAGLLRKRQNQSRGRKS